MSLEESRNPLAKGLLSIFNLVIWKHRKEQCNMNIVLRYCSVQSVKQSILLTSLLILSMFLYVCARYSWYAAELGRQTRVYCTHGNGKTGGTVSSAFTLPRAGGTGPWHNIAASKYFTSMNLFVFSANNAQHPTNIWASLVELHISYYEPKVGATACRPEDISSVQPHLFFFNYWNVNIPIQTYQPWQGQLNCFCMEGSWGKENVGRTQI